MQKEKSESPISAPGPVPTGTVSNSYMVTFAAGQKPPAKGFWSLILYNKHHFFSPNKLNGTRLGPRTRR
jgi:hypothetical protein